MNIKKKIFILTCILLIILFIATIVFTIAVRSRKNLSRNEDMIYIDDVLQDITSDSEDDLCLENEEDIIGYVEIPKIELIAPIKEGTEKETIDKYVGHFSNSNIWDGNVALAAHNRGQFVETYFSRLNELVNGDTIIYKTKLGEKSYKVKSVKNIENTDWSVTEGKTEEKNTITLLTCIANQSDKRLCIIAEEII